MKTCTELYKERLLAHPSMQRKPNQYDWPAITDNDIINFKLDAIMGTLDAITKDPKS